MAQAEANQRRKRRPTIRASDLKATLAALKSGGLSPSALDALPDGTFRWHFTIPTPSDQSDLDRELAEFDRKNGYS
jgi:hypothetical protein